MFIFFYVYFFFFFLTFFTTFNERVIFRLNWKCYRFGSIVSFNDSRITLFFVARTFVTLDQSRISTNLMILALWKLYALLIPSNRFNSNLDLKYWRRRSQSLKFPTLGPNIPVETTLSVELHHLLPCVWHFSKSFEAHQKRDEKRDQERGR